VRHALGPKEPVDGTPIDGEEERRRMVALRYEAERIAKRLGLPPSPSQPFPVDQTPTTLAREIRAEAEPLMAKADAAAMLSFERASETRSDGSTRSATRVQVNVFAPLSVALKSIVELVRTSLKGKFAMRAKVAKIGMDVSVKAEGSKE
jgi:hypothetical protein